MYGYLVITMVLTVALGVPAVVWLTKLVRPPKPEEEAIHRGVEEARRRIEEAGYTIEATFGAVMPIEKRHALKAQARPRWQQHGNCANPWQDRKW